MKFWKQSLLTLVLFAGVFTILFYTACEKNACDNVTCQHGGSCSNGICLCPTGYEGPQCQTLETARYVGTYVGYSACDNLADVVDTVTVATDPSGILNVTVNMKTIKPKVLKGYVNSNVSTYRILVTNNDTTLTANSHYYRTFTITLQSDQTLSINSYEEMEDPSDTIIHKCNFITSKKL